MTKFILIMYMCSMVSGQCPSSHIPGFEFDTHSDCVLNGYKIAHSTFKSLEANEEWDEEYVENNKIVVRFDCKAIQVPQEKLIIPPKKPKISA